jgi:hypothetical protein
VEQRALEVLPDGTPEVTVRELQERAREMGSGSLCVRAVPEEAGSVGTGTAAAVAPRGPVIEARLERCAAKRPRIALGARPSAPVVIELEIGEDGVVRDLRQTAGPRRALAPWDGFFRSCRFTPASRDGRPTAVRQTITFHSEPPPIARR